MFYHKYLTFTTYCILENPRPLPRVFLKFQFLIHLAITEMIPNAIDRSDLWFRGTGRVYNAEKDAYGHVLFVAGPPAYRGQVRDSRGGDFYLSWAGCGVWGGGSRGGCGVRRGDGRGVDRPFPSPFPLPSTHLSPSPLPRTADFLEHVDTMHS